MEFEYSLNYFNNFDKLIYQKNRSVLDVAYKLRQELDINIQKSSENFINYIMYLIVLNIFNEKNEYNKKYLKEEKEFINDFLNNKLDILFSVNYINIINNYLPYRKIYNDFKKNSDTSNNKLIVNENPKIYLNLFNYYSVVLNYNLNYCYYLRILTKQVNELYAEYYLIILFTLWKNPNFSTSIKDGKRNSKLIEKIIKFLQDNYNSDEEKILRYCYFDILYELFNDSNDFFLDYLNNIYNIIFEINNLVSNYLNSQGIRKLKDFLMQINVLNLREELNKNIWNILIKKYKNIEEIGLENFNLEIKNMIIELINLIRKDNKFSVNDDKKLIVYDEDYKLYIENFSKNFYSDFNLTITDDIIKKNYNNILIDLENDYFLIYLNLLENLKKKEKEISVTELYYNLKDMEFNNYVDENLIKFKYLNENAIFFFNNFILISSKIDYIKEIPSGVNLTCFSGNNYNIKNLSYKDNNVYAHTEKTKNRISGITAFSSFSFTNPGLKNIFFNNNIKTTIIASLKK